LSKSQSLFEVSWEVCNKVGGIHTVLSSKARTLVEQMGDDYVTVGPWLPSDDDAQLAPFDEESGFDDFTESCRELGLPVRVGRWRIPGRPLTLLIEFSALYERKDDIFAELWEEFSVDSISGDWDYIEPVLFGYAAGMVIEQWWNQRLLPRHSRTIAHFHEWMTGAGLLYLKTHANPIGTVFTTHATMLGRSLSSQGNTPDDGLGDETPAGLAEANGVVAKHSLEGKLVQSADVFTTVSEITAKEALLLHGRQAEPLLPNGIDLGVVDELTAGHDRAPTRARLASLAERFLGESVDGADFLCVSGRYEFHNKGIDLLLDAMGQINQREGKPLVLFVLVPAGHSGLRDEYAARIDSDGAASDTPLGISTHSLQSPDDDPVLQACERLALDNAHGSRVKVMQVPIYLAPGDGFLDCPYEAVLACMDLTCFPSFYEPWGYTPQESLAVGVPTITTDYAGFGRWALAQDLGPESGLSVLPRVHRDYSTTLLDLTNLIESFQVDRPAHEPLAQACRETANLTSWSGLIANYQAAYDAARDAVAQRIESGQAASRRGQRPHHVEPSREGREPRLTSFEVAATLPPELEGLQRLARNFWWCWNPDAQALFSDLSPESWASSRRNPVAFLARIFPEDLERGAQDKQYLARLQSVIQRFDTYMQDAPATWTAEGTPAVERAHPVAYFCAEFGVHESLPIYSGGLGILAGDHLKSASDVGMPLIGIGLFYRQGYMRQRMTADGEQIAADFINDPCVLALEAVREASGERVQVCLQLPGRELRLHAWKAMVGRTQLYLLDSDVPENREEDRGITRSLYGGDTEARVQQEIVLGRGGVRLLRRLGIEPGAYHMNEGHAAFSSLERLGHLVRNEGLTFDEAREVVRATTCFTTHTPVPAGHDRFGEDLLRRYFPRTADWVGLPWDKFFALGRLGGTSDDFNMTHLAIHFASRVNGVSKLHGIASRQLLGDVWPSLLESEIPVHSITNGIHLASWVAPGIAGVLGAKGSTLRATHFDACFKKAGKAIDRRSLWRERCAAKAQLLDAIRSSLRKTFVERHDNPLLLTRMLSGVEQDALWIGFARRFAPYKRAHLIFQDRERLRALLDSTDRPVRLVLAGKAHPRDQMGKDILGEIFRDTRNDDFAGRIFFLENYEIDLGRLLVSGVDVWLNNPTRMQEASGTSGMKAAANGGLNLSIGDGWWPEAFDGKNGWRIGNGREYRDQTQQDQLDSASLYSLLEDELAPLFHDRDGEGQPSEWLERVEHCLATVPTVFNTDRMVEEYGREAYGPLAEAARGLPLGRWASARSLARDKRRLRKAFENIRVLTANIADLSRLRVGDSIDVEVELDLPGLAPSDVVVELVLGHRNGERDLHRPLIARLDPAPVGGGGPARFAATQVVARSGEYAYGIRIRARAAGDPADSLRDLVRWV
jgi:phosphorylase/glycogen(starch) synthase